MRKLFQHGFFSEDKLSSLFIFTTFWEDQPPMRQSRGKHWLAYLRWRGIYIGRLTRMFAEAVNWLSKKSERNSTLFPGIFWKFVQNTPKKSQPTYLSLCEMLVKRSCARTGGGVSFSCVQWYSNVVLNSLCAIDLPVSNTINVITWRESIVGSGGMTLRSSSISTLVLHLWKQGSRLVTGHLGICNSLSLLTFKPVPY